MNLLAAPVTETAGIVGSCINCVAPANLMATLAVILIGAVFAVRFERRKTALARAARQ
jgi:hypothetical protein